MPGAPQVFIDPTTGLPYNRGFLQIAAPQRRRRRPPGRSAAHQLPHRRRHARRPQRRSGRTTSTISSAQTNFAQTYPNDFSVTRLARAIDVIDNPNTPGVDPVCRSVLDGTDPNCVPYDIFAHGPGHSGGARLSADPGLPARQHPADRGQRLAHRRSRRLGHPVPLGERAASASPSASNIARRASSCRPTSPSRPAAATSPARARRRSAVAGELRRPRGVRRGPHPDRRGQLLPQSLARSRLSLLGLRHRRAAASAPTPTRSALDFAPIRDIRFRGSLQPRGPRSEHPGAVRAAARRPRRQRRSVRGRRRPAAGRLRRLPCARA